MEADSFSSDSDSRLTRLADAYVAYQRASFGASREERKLFEGSSLEFDWSDVLATFAVGAPEAPALLLMIVDRMPENLLATEVGQLLIQTWLRSGDVSARLWLNANAASNSKLAVAVDAVDMS